MKWDCATGTVVRRDRVRGERGKSEDRTTGASWKGSRMREGGVGYLGV